jgi:DNA-binding MarR family transcriptional regulator
MTRKRQAPNRGDHDEVVRMPESRFGRRILHALRRIIRAVDVYSRELAAKHQVTGPQLVCLNAIVKHEPITATDLAHHVQLSPSNVVRILDRLEAKGLILRQRQEDDRRRILASATVTGHELSAKAPYSAHHPLRRALEQLPAEEQVVVTGLLEKLVDLMDAQGLSVSPVLEVGSVREETDPGFASPETDGGGPKPGA